MMDKHKYMNITWDLLRKNKVVYPICELGVVSSSQAAKYIGVDVKTLARARGRIKKDLDELGMFSASRSELIKKISDMTGKPYLNEYIYLEDGGIADISASVVYYYTASALAAIKDFIIENGMDDPIKPIKKIQSITLNYDQWNNICDNFVEMKKRLQFLEQEIFKKNDTNLYNREWTNKIMIRINHISHGRNDSNKILATIYRRMEQKFGISINQYIEDFKKENCVEKCSALAVISCVESLRDWFENILDEMQGVK